MSGLRWYVFYSCTPSDRKDTYQKIITALIFRCRFKEFDAEFGHQRASC